MGAKTWVRDGYSGRAYESPMFVGIVHMLHLEQSMMGKVNARGTGPYATITEQPVQGKARGGGQRLGEMEVWALEAEIVEECGLSQHGRKIAVGCDSRIPEGWWTHVRVPVDGRDVSNRNPRTA